MKNKTLDKPTSHMECSQWKAPIPNQNATKCPLHIKHQISLKGAAFLTKTIFLPFNPVEKTESPSPRALTKNMDVLILSD